MYENLVSALNNMMEVRESESITRDRDIMRWDLALAAVRVDGKLDSGLRRNDGT